MRRMLPLLALAALLPFLQGAGCPYGSKVPAGPPERFEPTLTGMWWDEGEDGELHLIEIVRAGDGLEVRMPTEDDDDFFAGHASVVGGARYMSLRPMKGSREAKPEDEIRYVLVRYEVTVDALTLRVVDDELFKAADPKPETQEALRAFLVAHQDDPALYDDDVLVWRRVHVTAAEPMRRAARLERLVKKLEERVAALEAEQGSSLRTTVTVPAPDAPDPSTAPEPPAAPDVPAPGPVPAPDAVSWIIELMKWVDRYYAEVGELPSSLDAVPKRYPVELPLNDPWGRPFDYRTSKDGTEYEISTRGADGAVGGVGEDADIVIRRTPARER